jgi:hypothetical protein
MCKVQAFLLTLLLAAGTTVQARQVDDVTIPDTVTVAGQPLQLNGAGMREKLFLDIYVGALYLPVRTHEVDAILSASGPASVLMHFVYHRISRGKITSAWTDGMRDNLTDHEMQVQHATLDRFNALFTELHKGDVVRIDYVPGQGSEVRINDELRGSVGDNAFFRDLLKIWLGPEPASSSLKKAMLGSE